jgi:hypothetical protein
VSLRDLRSQDGITVVELLVAISAGMAVLLGLFSITQGTLRSSARVEQRVDATQRARPVLARILDELHSSCVSPGIAPVLANSTDNSITFLHKTGTTVTPNPDKRVITYNPTTRVLTEQVYAYASGSAPNWVFSATPTTRTLLTNVFPGTVAGSTVPMFRYYAYDGTTGVIDPNPIPAPLDATEAKKTVLVDVAFAAGPSSTRVKELDPTQQRTAATVYDQVLFRFSPAAEDASQSQLPCT